MSTDYTACRSLLCLLFINSITLANAQNVNIPDPNFKSALVNNSAINTNHDSEIQVSEASAYTGTIKVSGRNINDLTGIEAFTAVTVLWCDFNNLTSIDVSANTELTDLRVNHNNLTSVDVSNNTKLTILRCHVNKISSLDLSANTQLATLMAFQNNLTSIDLSSNTALTFLQIGFNQISSLDLVANTNLTTVDVRKAGLTSFNIKNGNNTAITTFDARENRQLFCIQVDDPAWSQANWTMTDAGIFYSTDCAASQNDIVSIPDPRFKSLLVSNGLINRNNDSEIQVSEAQVYTGAIKVGNQGISDLTGIEAFTSLTQLEANNNNLTSINVSSNKQLVVLRINHNSISSLDLSNNTKLQELYAYYNRLTSLDIRANTAIRILHCFGNQLTSLDVSANSGMTDLQVNHNQLSSLVLGTKNNMTTIYAYANRLTSIDVSGIPQLWTLRINLNKLSSINLSNNPLLVDLRVGDNLLTSLDVSHNPNLSNLEMYNNKVTSMSIAQNPKVTVFYAEKNPFTFVDARNGHNTTLSYWNTLNTPQLSCIEVDDPAWSEFNWPLVDPASHFSINCNPSDDIVNIPDPNFKKALVGNSAINTNGDGEIQVTEARAYTGQIQVGSLDIRSLTGIEAFTSFSILGANGNHLTTLDLSTNQSMTQVDVGANELTSLVLGSNPKLVTVIAWDNNLTSIDVTGLPALRSLEIDENQLTAINVSQNLDLQYLGATLNRIVTIDLSDNINLKGFGVSNNNSLTYLNVKNGHNTQILGIAAKNNPNLHCIQVDDAAYAESHWKSSVDATATFSTDCNYSEDEIVYIPDPAFKERVVSTPEINTNGDGEIQVSEARAFTGFLNLDATGIADQTGLEAFTSIEALDVQHSNLSALDISANASLKYVDCGQNQIRSLKINTNLETLYCYYNQITSINLNGNTSLKYFDATDNNLSSLDLGSLGSTVEVLSVAQNPISSIDVSPLTNLVLLAAYETNITELDLNAATQLKALYASDNPELVSAKIRNGNNRNATDIDLRNCPKLTCIEVDDVDYASSSSAFRKDATAGYSENCGNAGGDVVYIPDPNLKAFLVSLPDINTNGDSEIQRTEAEAFNQTLVIASEDIHDATGMEAFINMKWLGMYSNRLTTLDVTKNTGLTGLDVSNNDLTSLKFGPGLTALVCAKNQLTSIDISQSQNLAYLDYSSNPMQLDISGLINLSDLYCNDNGLTSLDLSTLPKLRSLLCSNNQLTSLDFSNNPLLSWIVVSNNNLTALDVSNLADLNGLFCEKNQITSLDVSHNSHLSELTCSDNQLTSLNINGTPQLYYLHAENNLLTTVDLDVSYLDVIGLDNNRLTSFSLKGYEYRDYYFYSAKNNPDLHCVDVNDVEFAEQWWDDVFDAGVSFSTDCGGSEAGGRRGNLTVSAYPNPTTDRVIIESENQVDMVHVYDGIGGRLLDTQKGNEVDLSAFKKGMYVINVIQEGQVTSVRVVKE